MARASMETSVFRCTHCSDIDVCQTGGAHEPFSATRPEFPQHDPRGWTLPPTHPARLEKCTSLSLVQRKCFFKISS